MAENKKSFVMYADWIHTIRELTDDEAGKILKHLLSYVNDENPILEDRILKLVFEPIKLQLKRDLQKYEIIKEKRSEAGKQGGLASGQSRSKDNQNEANEANASETKQNEANEAVNDNVNDTDTVNVSDSIKPEKKTIQQRKLYFKELINPYLEKYGKQMLTDFYNYWTEINKSGKQLRFESEKFFEVNKRLTTWYNRSLKSFDKPNIDKLDKPKGVPSVTTKELPQEIVNNLMRKTI